MQIELHMSELAMTTCEAFTAGWVFGLGRRIIILITICTIAGQ